MQEPKNFTIKEIYNIGFQHDCQFGIKNYQIPKSYVRFEKDSVGKIGNFSVSPKRTKTEKSPWLNLNLKQAHNTPSAANYAHQRKWPEKDKSQNVLNKVDLKRLTKKNTYLEQLMKEKQKLPAPNKYDNRLTDFRPKSPKQQQSPNLKLHRETYTDDIEYLANAYPGPGQYNPHKEVKKIHVNKTDPKFWIEKHKKQNGSNSGGRPVKDKKKPDVGTYNPIVYNTFSKTWTDRGTFDKRDSNFLRQKSPKSEWKYPHTGFGLEVRFKKQDGGKGFSKVQQQKVPGPGAYNTIAYWPGKYDKVKGDVFFRNVYYQISKKPQINMYYENNDKNKNKISRSQGNSPSPKRNSIKTQQNFFKKRSLSPA